MVINYTSWLDASAKRVKTTVYDKQGYTKREIAGYSSFPTAGVIDISYDGSIGIYHNNKQKLLIDSSL